MFEGWAIVVLAVAYVGVLFAVAWLGDVAFSQRRRGEGRPFIYALSLAVYCTSWTFFGSVGLSAATGYDFIPVYLGPILMFLFGMPLILRIIRLAKSQNITSVSDFIAARYGKSPAVAAIVTIVAVVGTLPYIALQLKAIVISTETLLGGTLDRRIPLPDNGIIEAALLIALALAAFAMLFGTRHIDTTEHQEGLMLAIAAESVVKLVAFLAVGMFVLFFFFRGPSDFAEAFSRNTEIATTFGRSFHGGTWLTVTFLSLIAIILLPRQFHVTVVENNAESEVRRARWLFPLYLIAINLFVVPIAVAGMLVLPSNIVGPDMYVLALPMSMHSNVIAAAAYIGGLSAATAMVIVESVALSIMISNGLITPALLNRGMIDDRARDDLAGLLLIIRRAAILFVVLGGYAVYRALGQSQGLAQIGLMSFAAIAQLAPAFFGGLVWRQATSRGAIAGILAGSAVWAYTLMLPWIVKAGWLPQSIVDDGPLGFALLKPQALFFLDFEPLTHGVLWSLTANIVCYVAVSMLRAPEPVERMQALAFVRAEISNPMPATSFRLWRTSITVGDLQTAVARYLGPERAKRAFQEFSDERGIALDHDAEADMQIVRFTEHLLASAIGAASARLVLSLLLRRGDVGNRSALKLLDDASEALQYNRDLLQSALDQVRHGLCVFDKDLNLICWNRQFWELLDLPLNYRRVGVSLEQVLMLCAKRGDLGGGAVDKLVARRLVQMSTENETFTEHFYGGRRILEFRTAALPQGGIVTTISNITDEVHAASELARANETLERRVKDRTMALTAANAELGIAKAKADAANLDKTRFLAAAGHDILQPLNAARLYTASLIEKRLPVHSRNIALNVDASLAAVEDILEALIDLSRMDSGHIEPNLGAISLNDIFSNLRVEFEPLAQQKQIELRIQPTSLWVHSDRKLLSRVLQNLVSNALKYTRTGRVVVGARRKGDKVRIDVIDTGPGISKTQQPLIFKEFKRLDDASDRVPGIGLGLSIVDRICRVLSIPISLQSTLGKGTVFSVSLDKCDANLVYPAVQELATASELSPVIGRTILCIDNEENVLRGMKTLLSGWGAAVITATSKATALDCRRETSIMPDVILADYQLDDELGTDVIVALRKQWRQDIPAVIITADRTRDSMNHLNGLGYPVLHKPIKAAALRSLLNQLVLRRSVAE